MENDDNMSKNFDFYVEHQSELAKKYNGEYIVIVDRKVVGHFAKLEEAFEFANKKYHPGEFLLHQVGDGSDNYTTTISRIGTYA